MAQASIVGELAYEIDSLYVGTEMILSRRFREAPLDGLLLEATLLHFRVVWDFFYRPKTKTTDVVVRDYVPNWTAPNPPGRLRKIRKWLNVMLAHLTTHRIDPYYKAGEITEDDVSLIREHTKALFSAFVSSPFATHQNGVLTNPLAHKFTRYQTLSR
jgi:hypothetical protein